MENLQIKWSNYQATYDQLEAKLTEKEDDEGYHKAIKEHEEIESAYKMELAKFKNKLDVLARIPSIKLLLVR